jgi:hypothetical protein
VKKRERSPDAGREPTRVERKREPPNREAEERDECSAHQRDVKPGDGKQVGEPHCGNGLSPFIGEGTSIAENERTGDGARVWAERLHEVAAHTLANRVQSTTPQWNFDERGASVAQAGPARARTLRKKRRVGGGVAENRSWTKLGEKRDSASNRRRLLDGDTGVERCAVVGFEPKRGIVCSVSHRYDACLDPPLA